MNDQTDQQFTAEDSPYGQEFLAWEYDVRPNYQHGKWWYLGMVGGGCLLLILAIYSANFLFALITLMFVLVVYLASVAVPERRRCAVTEEGIVIGNRLYPYKELQPFWFAYNPPTVKKLYIPLNNRFNTLLSVHLDNIHPNQVRNALLPYIPEDPDNEGEPPIDQFVRFLKLA